jgi:hypothetical protein
MTANWTIDLGWPKNVMDTLTSFAPHAFYFDVSVTLNILGLLLLLWSRVPYPVTPSPIETLFRRKPTLSRAKNAG